MTVLMAVLEEPSHCSPLGVSVSSATWSRPRRRGRQPVRALRRRTRTRLRQRHVAIEDAGEAIPALAAVAGEDAFAPFFAGSLPLLLCKTNGAAQRQRSPLQWGVYSGPASNQFVSRLFPILLSAAWETDSEVPPSGWVCWLTTGAALPRNTPQGGGPPVDPPGMRAT